MVWLSCGGLQEPVRGYSSLLLHLRRTCRAELILLALSLISLVTCGMVLRGYTYPESMVRLG